MAVKWKGDSLRAKLRSAALAGVIAGTEMIREEALRLILHTRKTGRVYRSGNVRHRASAPGQAPASDTGKLVSSIRTHYDQKKVEGRVTAHAKYAPFLEYGTSKMAPRPFLRPALANKKEAVQKVIAKEIRKVLK